MPVVQIANKVAIVRLAIAPAEIPDLLRRHAGQFPGMEKLEAAGRQLVAGGFDAKTAPGFVKRVCEWGGGHRFADRVLQKNSARQISSALREGHQNAVDGWVAEGVERIGDLHHLGQSFASKQLRFMAPTISVILDSVIRARLGYTETVEGYREFLTDCQSILRYARKSDQLERGFRSTLRVCDIETALFSKVQGY